MRTELWPEDKPGDHAREIDLVLVTGPSDQAAAFVAEEANGALVGFVEMSVRAYAEECRTSRVGYVEGWYVAPGARRKGVGRALIAAGIEWAKERGCTEFASDAVIDNHASHAAHLALGFEEVVRIVCFKLSNGPPGRQSLSLPEEPPADLPWPP
jgi:aminoglycoside 6'-N-acetyltransferase I